MENRELEMTELKDTPNEYLQEALLDVKESIKKLPGMDRKELYDEVLKLSNEKEFLKATIKFMREKILKLSVKHE